MDEEITEVILENAADCPSCGFVTSHDILRERKAGTGTDYLLKCAECGEVHKLQVREPKAVKIPFMLSEGAETRTAKICID